jgi:hypothetical protein
MLQRRLSPHSPPSRPPFNRGAVSITPDYLIWRSRGASSPSTAITTESFWILRHLIFKTPAGLRGMLAPSPAASVLPLIVASEILVPMVIGDGAQLEAGVTFGNHPDDRGLPAASLELSGKGLRLLKGGGVQLEGEFVHLHAADNRAWCRIGAQVQPSVGSDQIGAGAETLAQSLTHVPAGVRVMVGRGHERPANAFARVWGDGEVVWNAHHTEEE